MVVRSLKTYELFGLDTANLVLSEEECKHLKGRREIIRISNNAGKCPKTMLCESHIRF